MEDTRNTAIVLGAVLLLAAGAIAAFFLTPGTTGQISAYQQMPHQGGVENVPDPHTQYITFDESLCNLVLTRYATFYTWVNHQCKELNWGRQKRQADCRYDAELKAETMCRPAPVFANVRPPRFVTGEVAVDPLGCAGLAENYDVILQSTFARAGTRAQTIAMVNPCTSAAEAATRHELSPEAPLRDYIRTFFANNDVTGMIAGDETGHGEVRYVRCNDGRARVRVSGTPICDTLSAQPASEFNAYRLPAETNSY